MKIEFNNRGSILLHKLPIMSNETVYLAIDIEKVDDYQSSPIVAFGACLGDINGTVLESHAWYPALPQNAKFGERCKREFWDKQVGLYATFEDRAEPTAAAYNSFVAWLNGLEAHYGNIVVLSDNPAYDLGSLDHQLERYCGRLPVRYTSLGEYRCVSDWSEQCARMGAGAYGSIMARAKAEMGELSQLIHNPEVDAELIYRCTIITERIAGRVNADVSGLVAAAIEKLNIGSDT